MFREMRRKKQELSKEESIEILLNNKTGVLSVAGDDNYPYGIPLNYVYMNSKIYFHCAKEGHKIDAIKQNNKVSFCVIDRDEIVQNEFTNYFRSVIVFAKARIIENENNTSFLIDEMTKKLAPDETKEVRAKEIEKFIKHLAIIELDIEHIGGKMALGLLKQRINF